MTDKLTKVDKARIELWTARDMLFMVSREKGVRIIPRYTKCVKPAYTHKIKDYLDRMEKRGFHRPSSNPKAVCVKLEGMLRYVWRTDVLTEEEYEERIKKERASTVGVFGSKSKRSVDQGKED